MYGQDPVQPRAGKHAANRWLRLLEHDPAAEPPGPSMQGHEHAQARRIDRLDCGDVNKKGAITAGKRLSEFFTSCGD